MARLSVIVCAYNEERFLGACLHSLLAQTRLPDEIIVVDNASTDHTREVACGIAGVRVVAEPRKGLVRARERGRLEASGDVLAFVDADCRAPVFWLERLERAMTARPRAVALTGSYRYYDWDWIGRTLIRLYDFTLAPFAQVVAQDVLRMGAVLYGGNFAVRREALEAIGGFDTRIEFHGEDTNLARRLVPHGRVVIAPGCFVYTSARRFVAMGRGQVFRLYIRNFWSEIVHQRPADVAYRDVGR